MIVTVGKCCRAAVRIGTRRANECRAAPFALSAQEEAPRTRNLSTLSAVAATSAQEPLRFCVVGSGPAGFYTADKLFKISGRPVSVDILDRLPTPFGLVRSGVAPDHPNTKSVINRFSQIMDHPKCTFYGNVALGRDVSVEELRARYHGVILSYGTEDDRRLNVQGEELGGVFSAREMVWWYNGHPEYRHLPINLSSTDTAVIFGLGNVAVDCARILLQDPAGPLRTTDIAQHALEALAKSTVKKVYMVGRRGPVQGAFAPKELKEMLSVEGVKVVLREADMHLSEEERASLQAGERRPRRVYEVLEKAMQASIDTAAASAHNSAAPKELHILFYRNPSELAPSDSNHGRVHSVTLEKTKVVEGRAVGTGETETLTAGLVLRSIGYKGVPVEGLPFDQRSGTVPNVLGRVVEHSNHSGSAAGLYVCGWLKRGPSGIIGSNSNCADETVHSIRQDLEASALPVPTHGNRGDDLAALLNERGVSFVTHEGWNRIDVHETELGRAVNKPREKLASLPELLQAANGVAP